MNETDNGSAQIASAEDYRSRNTVLEPVPSGLTFRLRRPGPDIWLRFMRLPSSLKASARDAREEEASAEGKVAQAGAHWVASLSEAELAAWLAFCAAMVKAVCDVPRIAVVEADGLVYDDPHDPTRGREARADELRSDELDSGDFWHLFGWGFRNGATLPVEMEGGETTTDALESFRDESSVSSPMPSGRQAESAPIEPVGVA